MRLSRRIRGQESADDGAVLIRMAFVLAFVLAGFGWVVAQASVYQLSEDATLASRSDQQLRGNFAMEGRRGDILDRTGHRRMAVSVPSPAVAFFGAPYWVDRSELAYTLAEILDLDPEELARRIIPEDKYAMLKKDISEDEVELLGRMDLPGVRVVFLDRRSYPAGGLAGSLLGFVGRSGQGMAGVEAHYDSLMRGAKRVMNVIRDSARRGFYDDGMVEPWTLDGGNLVLTIDQQIQLALDSELLARVQSEQAVGGMAVVLDARTFEVLAMSSVPLLDPNAFEDVCGKADQVDDGSSPCRNKVISYVYEPGSVGKIITAAAAFDSGKMTPSTPADGYMGSCSIGKFTIRDVHRMGLGTIRDAIKFSSNCAMKDVALKVGIEKMRAILEKFGIGGGTGVDLPAEARGTLAPSVNWGTTQLATTGYGYGYSTTLIQLASVVATIVNDGVRLKPRVVREVRNDNDEVVKRFDASEGIRVISPEAARMVRETMEAVIMDKDGTAAKAKPNGYSAAGKTGTARANTAGQGYSTERWFCSFVGYAPAEAPRVVVAITVIDPKVNKFGGTVAAPVFKNVIERILPVLGVLPEVDVKALRDPTGKVADR